MSIEQLTIGVALGMCAQAFIRYAWNIIWRVVAKQLLKSSARLRRLVYNSNLEERLLRAQVGAEK